MRRILVLRGGALGDFIVTLPALAALRTRWPGAQLELVGNAVAAGLVRGRGLLDAVHSQHEARWAALHSDDALPGDFAAWLADFDLVLNFWPDPDGRLAQRLPVRPDQVFLTAAGAQAGRAAAAHFCTPLRPLGIEPASLRHGLGPPGGNARANGPIAVHPGSGSPRKNWPADRWRRLLAQLDGPISLILGEAEGSAWDDLALSHVTPVRGRTLAELAAQLAGCRLFLGHDSGVSHLAAACGARCMLLFGPTDPAIWAPPGPWVQVLSAGPDLTALSVDAVLASAQAALRDPA